MSESRNNTPRSALAKLLQPGQSPDTDALINSFDRFNLSHSGNHNDNNSAADQPQLNPFLDSTTSYIDANLQNLRGFRRRLSQAAAESIATNNNNNNNNNVSESTVGIKNNLQITPLKRSVSGSSLLVNSSPEPELPNVGSRKRSNSLPHEEHYEEQFLDLSLLNILLEQLPDTERYNNFKGVLENYLQILEEHDMNFAKDRFIITIFNQLKNHHHSHAELERVVDIFLNEPSNFAMIMSNHLYFKNLAIRQKFLKIWLIKRRITYELNQSWKIWMIYLQKKHLSQWIYKHKVISEDLESNAMIFGNVKRLMKVWDVWRTSFQQQESYANVADLQQESKFFNSWKERIEIDNDRADTYYQENLLRTSIRRWKLSTRLTCNVKLKPYFTKWKQKKKQIADLQIDGSQLEKVFHAGFFFSKWKAKSQETLSKTKELENIYNQSLASKYFSQWSESMYYKSIENQVLEKRDLILLGFTINQWCQRLQHRQILQQFNNEQGKITELNVLKLWQRQLMLKQRAAKAGDSTILSAHFNIWKLSTNRQIHEHTKDYNKVLSIFVVWKRRTELKKLAQEYELQIVNKYWDRMVLKKIKGDNALEAGADAYGSYSKVIYFNHWRRQLDQVHDSEAKADGFILRIFFIKMKNKYSDIKLVEQKVLDYQTNISSKVTMKRAFNNWHSKYEESLKSKLESKLTEYQTKCQELKLASVLKTWNNQYKSYISQEQIFKEEFLSGLYLRPSLNKWILKYNTIREMEDKADDVNNLNLLSTGFTKLQLAFLRVEDLENKLIEFEDDADVKLILKYLNSWSLKLLKVRRDNENIASFQRRWNRAHCRAILLLWKGKVLDRQLSGGIEEEEIDDNEDDESPTKFKSTFSSVLPAETPRKSIIHSFNSGVIDRSPLAFGTTSRKTASIPGSERIKRKRYEALKTHYSQIKYAIPSPLKSQAKSSSKKLDFSQSTLPRDHTNQPLSQQAQQQQQQQRSSTRDYFMDDSFSTDIDIENPISSPVISHQKINQQFFNRFSNQRPASEEFFE